MGYKFCLRFSIMSGDEPRRLVFEIVPCFSSHYIYSLKGGSMAPGCLLTHAAVLQSNTERQKETLGAYSFLEGSSDGHCRVLQSAEVCKRRKSLPKVPRCCGGENMLHCCHTVHGAGAHMRVRLSWVHAYKFACAPLTSMGFLMRLTMQADVHIGLNNICVNQKQATLLPLHSRTMLRSAVPRCNVVFVALSRTFRR